MLVTREYQSLARAREAIGTRLDRGSTASLFDRIDWLESLHDHCFDGVPVRILRAMEDEAEAWLFLLAPDQRRLSALANWYSFEWGPIFFGSPDALTRRRLVEVLAQNLLKDGAQVDLYPVTEDAALLIDAFRRAGWFGLKRPMGGRYLLRPNGRSFAEYWAARPGRLRNLVQRKARASRFTLSIGRELTDALWRDYAAVHARSWKQPEPNLNFLRTLAQREGAAGTLRLGFVRLEDQPVAAQFWTVENGVALIHKLAHDQAFDGASPGTLLSHAMFADAIDGDRVALIDYGTGDNGYKSDWMEERTTLHRLDFFNPRFASTWLPAARTAISALVG
ncbi:GNAT family N-acetyltransferase [Sphingobium bisphenolivorans]|uniref:GNAT family N-acetyltransferase n=1 Tax=Sphingobium bisphenolivorans TaxID=1335760 RepID=UPI0003B63892|nr:GNAT family N-acetyltransferase [Sphingobium bisphenolivorans]